MIVWHDSYGGLRVNGRQQVIDMQGAAIPGLFAGGEAAGGFDKHGLGKGTCRDSSPARMRLRRAARKPIVPRYSRSSWSRSSPLPR